MWKENCPAEELISNYRYLRGVMGKNRFGWGLKWVRFGQGKACRTEAFEERNSEFEFSL